MHSYVAFGELCCRLTVEFYASTAVYAEVTNHAVLADVVRTFARVLALKYELAAESTWKTVRRGTACFTSRWRGRCKRVSIADCRSPDRIRRRTRRCGLQ